MNKCWIEIELGKVANYLNGRAFKPIEWEEKGLPIIRIQNLNNIYAKYNYSSNIFEERYRVKKGDLLFAWSASLGAYIWKGGDGWLNRTDPRARGNVESGMLHCAGDWFAVMTAGLAGEADRAAHHPSFRTSGASEESVD